MITPELVEEEKSLSFAPELIEEKKSLSFVKCRICHKNANPEITIKKMGISFGVICKRCSKLFTDRDIELMHNMFTAFGGYFSKMSNSKEVTVSKLKEIAKNYKTRNKNSENIENEIKTLHSAFLYGIRPQQLVKSLKLSIN
ncbi:MAG: hypothetical protein HWN79_03030 [Candidatus Lokiarchaeota archaeon]|nr:hypothetical protein [Candidatus Lokiarchaeota archaeon]